MDLCPACRSTGSFHLHTPEVTSWEMCEQTKQGNSKLLKHYMCVGWVWVGWCGGRHVSLLIFSHLQCKNHLAPLAFKHALGCVGHVAQQQECCAAEQWGLKHNGCVEVVEGNNAMLL